jgi:hypothetical protein
LDYYSESGRKFLKKEYTFNDPDFDTYRQENFLFFAHIIRPDHESYKLYLSMFSYENNKYGGVIRKVELMNAERIILYVNVNIINEELPQPTVNGLFVTYVTLIDNIPQQQLPKGNYTVKVYFENTVFIYSFYPKERKYAIAISQ